MTDWHKTTCADAVKQLDSDAANGLSSDQVASRHLENGPNELVESSGRGPWRILWEQLSGAMVVLLVINLELAQITPPVGMNLFTIKAITRAPIGEIVRGSAPYVLLMIAVMAAVMIWPQIALWLPGTMFAR